MLATKRRPAPAEWRCG